MDKNKRDKYIEEEEEDIEQVYENEQEECKDYLTKFRNARDFDGTRFDAYEENMAFYECEQYKLARYKESRPWVINMDTPYATLAIDNRVGSLMATDYLGDLLPYRAEDVELITNLDKFKNIVWDYVGYDRLIDEAILKASIVREAYIHTVLDLDKKLQGSDAVGRLKAYLLEPGAITIDPEALSLKEANYMFVSERITKKEAFKRYDKVKQLSDLGFMGNYQPKDRGEVYLGNDYNTYQENVLTKLTFYEKVYEEIEDANDDGEKSVKVRIRKTTLVEDIIVAKSIIPLSQFPVTQLRCYKKANSCYGLSMMDRLLSLQKAVNSIESAVVNTAITFAAPSMVVSKASGINPKKAAKASGAPGVVYQVNGSIRDAIGTVGSPTINDSIVRMKNDNERLIDKISGNSDEFMGDFGSAGNTAGGSERASNRSKIVEKTVLSNIEEFVEDLTNTVIEFIKIVYWGEKVSYIDKMDSNKKAQFKEVELPGKEVLEGLDYRFKIKLEQKTPYSREEQKAKLFEIFTTERQYNSPVKTVTTRDLIFNSELENRDIILERYDKLSAQAGQEKVQMIKSILQATSGLDIEPELLDQALLELVDENNQEQGTPALDQVMDMLKKNFEQNLKQQEQAMSQEQGKIEDMAQTTAPMGDDALLKDAGM